MTVKNANCHPAHFIILRPSGKHPKTGRRRLSDIRQTSGDRSAPADNDIGTAAVRRSISFSRQFSCSGRDKSAATSRYAQAERAKPWPRIMFDYPKGIPAARRSQSPGRTRRTLKTVRAARITEITADPAMRRIPLQSDRQIGRGGFSVVEQRVRKGPVRRAGGDIRLDAVRD